MMFSSSRSRLVSGGARAGSHQPQTTQQRANDNQASTELPEYEPPRFLLNDAGLKQLKELVSSPLNEKLAQHSKESLKLLGNAVWAVNERATNRKKRATIIAERAAKRRRTDDEGEDERITAEVDRAKALAREMEDEAEPLTLQLEQATREMLDLQAALQDEKQTLSLLPDTVNVIMTEKRQEAALGEDEDQEDIEESEVAGIPLYNVYEAERGRKAAEYEGMSARQKYVKNNAYIDFKRLWHEGLYPNDEVPVPDPRTWFDRDGKPQHQVASGAEGDVSDAELQFASENRTFRCPLSLVPMTKPYTSRRCKHSFQKEAILGFIKTGNHRGTEKPCPQTGCEEMITLEDLYFDESLLRRIKRAEVQEDEEDEDRDAQDERRSQEQEEEGEGEGQSGEDIEGASNDEY